MATNKDFIVKNGIQVGNSSIISVNNTTDALRITQTGTGNALVIEDSANPDNTPIVIDTNGELLVGLQTAVDSTAKVEISGANISLNTYVNDQSTYDLRFRKSRNVTPGNFTIVSNNDTIGTLNFFGDDGTKFQNATRIDSYIDGTPGLNSMPGRISFSTTPPGANTPIERMRINSNGTITITATTASTNANNGSLVVAGGVGISGNTNIRGNLNITGNLSITSATLVANLNSDLLDGYNTNTANSASTVVVRGTDGSLAGYRFTSTAATGVSPLVVSSTTLVTNLNADLLDGYNTGNTGATIPLLNGINTWANTQTFQNGVIVSAGSFSGSGSGLTSLNASNVSSGTINSNRLGSGTANANTVLYGDNTWKSIVSGATLSGVDNTSTYYIGLSSATFGTWIDARVDTANLYYNSVTSTLYANNVSGSGSGLTSLNASNVSSGTIATARLASGTANANTVLYGDNTWKSIVSGASILNDVATNENYYPMWATTNAGTPTTVYVSNTKLYFNPSTGTLNATIFNSLSDENQKTDIKIINNAQNIINQINGVEFTWKDNGKPSSGVIAQELEKILPNLVDTNENLVKSVNYNGIIAYLIQTVKELDSRIKILENK